MDDEQDETALHESMRSAREEYERLTRAYDAFLARAHQNKQGSPAMVLKHFAKRTQSGRR